MAIPVYFITGMLDSGKTIFVNKLLSTLPTGVDALLLCCEKGEEEFVQSAATVLDLCEEGGLTKGKLTEIAQDYHPAMVLIEYNGMWPQPVWKDILPSAWSVFQRVCLADASCFELYMQNMPQFIMDKIRESDMVILNRCTVALAAQLRKRNLRLVNRRAGFHLEFTDGHIEPYKIPGTSNFDLTQQEIHIPQEDFSLWYTEVMDNPGAFVGKIIHLQAMVDEGSDYAPYLAVGRWIMTCCEQDMCFYPIACQVENPEDFQREDWVELTATVGLTHWQSYEKQGPLLQVTSIKKLER